RDVGERRRAGSEVDLRYRAVIAIGEQRWWATRVWARRQGNAVAARNIGDGGRCARIGRIRPGHPHDTLAVRRAVQRAVGPEGDAVNGGQMSELRHGGRAATEAREPP